MLRDHLIQLQRGNLSLQHVPDLISEMLEAQANEIQVAACLSHLSFSRVDEGSFLNIVSTLKSKQACIDLPGECCDIVGTGGDDVGTVNISTGSALLAAAMGVKIAKHGNHAASSQCGSADVMSALGINLFKSQAQIKRDYQQLDFAFLYAPLYQSALKKLRLIRKSLGVKTVFNLTGPLLNPAGAKFLLLGVCDDEAMSFYVNALKYMPVKRAIVFCNDQCDELMPGLKVKAKMLNQGCIEDVEIDSDSYGLSPCELNQIQGGNAAMNANLLLQAFSGKHKALIDTLALNAGVAAFTYGLMPSIKEGVGLAKTVLFSGKVMRLVNNLKEGADGGAQ